MIMHEKTCMILIVYHTILIGIKKDADKTVQVCRQIFIFVIGKLESRILAHLSRRLISELIGYSWSGLRPSSGIRRPSNAQRSSSPKPLGQLKPNFMWSLLG